MIPQVLLCVFFFIFWPPLIGVNGGDYIPYMPQGDYIHDKRPLICIFEPYDTSIKFEQRHILDSTLMAIGEWQDNLNRITHSNNWNFSVLYVPLNNVNVNHKCSIFVLYEKSDKATGFTQFDPSSNSSTIIIYTSIMLGKNGMNSIPIEFVRTNHQMQLTMEHELGHAMGLNHLQTITNDEKTGIYNKINAEKSIMYYALNDLHPDPLVSIKNSDLNAIITHYGGYGWGHITNTIKYTID